MLLLLLMMMLMILGDVFRAGWIGLDMLDAGLDREWMAVGLDDLMRI